ncbi:protein VASCULAR ASSOCIATED DEATH 1, chloroplastic isoform X1 [Iris pallida]|uniref:Protein VASCULAR ASSOCIATED DEATH 1, chloroplastic isoform X1 n=2 Tax=Iris pallida TaxID=29817 RepID=A0AAX6GI01_IRIPA|nr:protein VASCULAR ASSOCIATED DEATH 1, chloroplastic isoform X1 [Iris pallida]
MAVAPPSSEKIDQSTRCSPSGSARHEPDAAAASDCSSAHDGDSSGRRDVDVLAQLLPSRSEEYRLLFRLPPDEVLVQDFNCALQENILLQGHMYLFIHHICFYSNIFGFETKKTIPFHEVTCVRKAKTAAIFPNAIEIVSGEKKHFFGSFLSRDEAYKLIIDGWAQHCSDAKAILERQEAKSDSSSQDNASLILENATGSQRFPDNSSSSDMNKDAINSEECKSLSNVKSHIEGSESVPGQENGGEENADGPSSSEPFTWRCEDVDAPKIAQHFTMVAEATFPISVEEFFTLFISDRASDFLENFRKLCGDKEFQFTPWRQHEQLGHTRDLSFLHPVKVYIGAKFGRCQETQKFRVYRNSHLVIETSQQVSDVPYADYFTVEGIWDVETNGSEENGCILKIYFSVPFSKKTIFKGKIEQSTRDELRDVLAIWINNAHELVKQKKIEEQEGISSQNTSMILDQEVGNGSSPTLGLPRTLHTKVTPSVVTQTVPDRENQIESLMHKLCGYSASFASSLRDSWATFVSYTKSQDRFPLYLLVAAVAILILMQANEHHRYTK